MITMIDADFPFDIRACPIWAIPAIGRVLRTPGVEILSFRIDSNASLYEMEPGTPDDAGKGGILTLLRDGKLYKALVYKNHMNTYYYPRLFGWEIS